MKRLSILVVLVAAIMLVAAGAAFAGVIGTKHDIRSVANATGPVGFNVNTSQVCVYCHTPHSAEATVTGAGGINLLWQKTAPSGPLTAYDSETMNATMSVTMTGVTKACLSCHDGSLSVFQMANAPNSGGYATGVTAASGNITALGRIINNPRLTSDMSNDHPIGISYCADNTVCPGQEDTTLTEIASLNIAIKLFANKVECASCHAVHDNTNAPFLRLANSSSQLCTACHAGK